MNICLNSWFVSNLPLSKCAEAEKRDVISVHKGSKYFFFLQKKED